MLYEIGRVLAECDASERQRRRAVDAQPIVDAIGERLEALVDHVRVMGLWGKAVTHERKQWPRRVRYIDDGVAAIHDHLAERGAVGMPVTRHPRRDPDLLG